jgi:hypothetical protein
MVKDITDAVVKNAGVPADAVVVSLVETPKASKAKGGVLSAKPLAASRHAPVRAASSFRSPAPACGAGQCFVRGVGAAANFDHAVSRLVSCYALHNFACCIAV